MGLPSDDNILLSLVNTRLRDGGDVCGFCAEMGAEEEELISRLAAIGYYYDEKSNAFKSIQN